MRKLFLKGSSVLLWMIAAFPFVASSQVTFPVNGVAEPTEDFYVFTNATIVKDAETAISDATLVIRKGKIIAVGKDISIPEDAVAIDCKGKYIYPSFVDIYSDYGVPVPVSAPRRSGYGMPSQLTSNTKGAYGWNQALQPEVDAYKLFTVDNDKADGLRSAGFGVVLTHRKDGIARGTGTVVSLAEEKENLVVLKERASANYSFNKGSSTQSYPTSLMGSIALLRQTYLDGQWYKTNPPGEGMNISLQAWNNNQHLPQIFEANDKWNDIRADRIGDEFGVQYILKGGGNEYQRLKEVKATNAAFIIPLNFPQAMDVEDPNSARYVSLADLKHWEMAPSNPAAMERAGITFCLTAADLKDPKEFLPNLRKALKYGLTEKAALEALTKIPATLLGMYDEIGSIEPGKRADFLITNDSLFDADAKILQNWVQGKKYDVEADSWTDIKGNYTLNLSGMTGQQTYSMDVKTEKSVVLVSGSDSLPGKLSFNGKLVTISFPLQKKAGTTVRLSGSVMGDLWQGTGVDTAGSPVTWSASFNHPAAKKADSASRKPVDIGTVYYPFDGYGWEHMPIQEDLLIRNATVWTNEKEGILQNADVLVKDGKIAAVGKNLSGGSARIIDGTGKYLSPGIVDEHSHIATVSINEGGQSVTSEVRIKDNLDPEDIDIYRQLSGGVTTSHILHGSANTIGGQTQLIKLRWGTDDKGLMFQGWQGFIKFALGENVKRSSSPNNNRYPDTRMGVEQVLSDAFQRATDYKNAMAAAKENNRKKGAAPVSVRRDLELDALVEILNGERNITCHSYVQSEITAAMRVAEKYGFKFNTFTHVLEGYKIADKLKAHGANVSTFSDWWEYKSEVIDAIPYNASIMHAVGLNVAINSDDPEMARRLNQEAAKSVKYGGMSEEEAFKMVTLNPARMLHVDDRIGSIKVGKDADLVLWSDNPLSIYAVAEKTIVDGIVYFDRERDKEMRRRIQKERNRLIQKMIGEKKSGAPVKPATPSIKITNSCGDHLHSHGLFVVNGDNELLF